MKKAIVALFTLFFGLLVPVILIAQSAAGERENPKFLLAIHGGAGTILKEQMTDSLELAYRTVLKEALQQGYQAIQEGRDALDAVEITIQVLEDSPLFNAGRGAVFTHEGKNEMDASIMEGATRNAGAVAGLWTVKNPIRAARAVMEQSEHVLLSGDGAERFAGEVGLQRVDPSYFHTDARWGELQKMLQREQNEKSSGNQAWYPAQDTLAEKFGTVGCVALDLQGHLAAGTSTGGMTNKRFGRIGDSPIIGAGTYADNQSAAISCTGWGEYFIRHGAALQVCAKIQYQGVSLSEAASQVIQEIDSMGGHGGLIAINPQGEVAMPFNTAGMYRGTVSEDGRIDIAIYGQQD